MGEEEDYSALAKHLPYTTHGPERGMTTLNQSGFRPHEKPARHCHFCALCSSGKDHRGGRPEWADSSDTAGLVSQTPFLCYRPPVVIFSCLGQMWSLWLSSGFDHSLLRGGYIQEADVWEIWCPGFYVPGQGLYFASFLPLENPLPNHRYSNGSKPCCLGQQLRVATEPSAIWLIQTDSTLGVKYTPDF